MSYSNRAYMHGYCSTCAFMHNFTPTDVSFCWSKCAYLDTFSILHLLMQVLLYRYFWLWGGGDQEIIIGNRDGEND